MRLFVDDSRPFPSGGYECCRDPEQAKLLLSVLPFDHVSLDYDLGYGKETGYDLLVWMDENNIRPAHINIHSTHFFGRKRMMDYAEQHFPGSELTAVMLP